MKTVPLQITKFENDWSFLHPFYPCEVIFDGVKYPSAEHAYQAAKSTDPNKREIIRNLLDGETAKSYGRRMRPVREDFKELRFSIMQTILESKFFNNIQLAKNLLETGDAQLIYTVPPERWDDRFWSISRGEGQNNLGLLLMHIRGMIKAATTRAAQVRLSRVKFSTPRDTPTQDFVAEYQQEPYFSPELVEALEEHKAANNPDRTLSDSDVAALNAFRPDPTLKMLSSGTNDLNAEEILRAFHDDEPIPELLYDKQAYEMDQRLGDPAQPPEK